MGQSMSTEPTGSMHGVPDCGPFLTQGAGNRPVVKFDTLTPLLPKSSFWELQPTLREKVIEEKKVGHWKSGCMVCSLPQGDFH